MRKNVSTIATLLMVLLLLTACQPTPEAEPVIQKDTGKLIEMAVGVADNEAGTQPEAQKPTLAERFGERFTVDYTTTTSGARVVGDVKIHYLSDYAFPMFRVQNARPEGEKVRELAKRLLGSEEVYEKTSFQTKADLKAEIDGMTSALSNEEWMEMHREDEGDNYEAWLAAFMQEIQDLQAKYNAMTGEEERPLFDAWDCTYSEEPLASRFDFHALYLVAHEDDFGDVPRVEVFYGPEDESITMQFWRDVDEDFGYGSSTSEIPEDWDVPCGNASMTPREAADAAVALFDGILDVMATEVRWGGNSMDNKATSGHAYTVYLSTVHNGAGGIFSWMSNTSQLEEGPYTFFTWSHERIRVVVNETGIRSCTWEGQMAVQEVLSEEVNLLDFDTIYNLFLQQMNRNLATEEAGTEYKLFGVTLGLMRIREEDSLYTALTVPVWYFRGGDASRDFSHQPYLSDMDPLCVLNAIDGSVVSSGY